MLLQIWNLKKKTFRLNLNLCIFHNISDVCFIKTTFAAFTDIVGTSCKSFKWQYWILKHMFWDLKSKIWNLTIFISIFSVPN